MSRLLLPARSLALLLALLLLAGCSRMELVYRNLDYLIPWKVDDYLSLDAKQSAWLDARLDAHLRWHCQSELPRYIDWLDHQRPLLAGSPSSARLEAALGEARTLLQPTFARLAPDAAQLLAGLSAEQIAELDENLAEERAEFAERYLGGSLAERLQRRVEVAQPRLEFWLGPLHPQQRAYLRLWAARQEAGVRPWLDNRTRWQTGLLAQLRQTPRAELAARLEPQLAAPDRHWDGDYRQALQRSQQSLAELLAELWASATPTQRAYLQEQLDSLSADLGELVCRD
ncbi:DUF6279 family lipoprotein [Pseudomonas sp. GCM10022188]|uniref:DUF6279 family lipoprotein n=1 Tax=Pseudomonas TaxID=286 RepID=UPI001E2B8B36|nr:DUF6279 family lipoprotein [Pseudomonas oryzagri]MCC6073603.1 DUF6279 family lipoprotein [Pseudomonas oryzagri]